MQLEGKVGERHPMTIKYLNPALFYLYNVACCSWGCSGGDHTIERMIGKAVNQAVCSFQLYRAAYYDESLMLTRGIGEIANLLYLFHFVPTSENDWKTLDERARYNKYKPSAVRKALAERSPLVPIEQDRYSRLCAIGTHPDPKEVPGHYTGIGLPVLGMVFQEVGAFVSINELAYAIGMITAIAPKLIKLEEELGRELKELSIQLIRNIGSFTVLNYQEHLQKIHGKKPE